MTNPSLTLRPCAGFDELDACVQLQVDVWGFSDGDVIPRRVFLVAQRIGGQVIGAFDSGRLIGFVMAIPGVKAAKPGLAPQPYLHSHMLAVSPEYRNLGIGQRLKLYQRDEALSRGIRLMEWTFDPLEIKNAFLNIRKLGAIVRTYTPNFYGLSSSRLQGALPTDRLHAEWWLDSVRVNSALAGHPPGAASHFVDAPSHLPDESILVPAALADWKAQGELARAEAVQTENRRRFQQAFARGLAVTGFRRDPEGNGIFELSELRSDPL